MISATTIIINYTAVVLAFVVILIVTIHTTTSYDLQDVMRFIIDSDIHRTLITLFIVPLLPILFISLQNQDDRKKRTNMNNENNTSRGPLTTKLTDPMRNNIPLQPQLSSLQQQQSDNDTTTINKSNIKGIVIEVDPITTTLIDIPPNTTDKKNDNDTISDSTMMIDTTSINNTWNCSCANGQFLPKSIFGNMDAILKMGSGQCYHKQ
jgi:hypothetical protein